MIKDEQRIVCGCEILPMTQQDLTAAAALYRAVAVTRENHRLRLKEGEHSFRSHGGMFQIQDLTVLTKLLHDPREHVRLAWYNGEPRGLLWFGSWEAEAFAGLEPFPESGCESDVLRCLGSQGLLGYAKEIIVTPPAPSRVTARQLFLEMMLFFERSGKPYVTGEVYKVTEFEDESGQHSCDMLNMASYSTLLQTGGKPLGQTPPRKMVLDGFSVTVRPQIFLWESANSVRLLQSLLPRTEETQ